ncbi:unnamed protein product [Closterium sp. NIES-54]
MCSVSPVALPLSPAAQVPYECLQPGHVYRQESYVQHPWVFRDEATHEPFVVGKRAVRNIFSRKITLFHSSTPVLANVQFFARSS